MITNQSIESLGQDLDDIQVAESTTCNIDDIIKHIPFSKTNFNLLSQNIRSLNCNMNNFETLLQRSLIPWDVIVLTECWLPSAKCIPHLDNYSFAMTTNNKTQNEGVVVYYNSRLSVTHEEPAINDANCLLLKINNNICIIAIYRPPSKKNINDFVTSLDSLLITLSAFKNIILCGDINIDISPKSTDQRAYDYLNVLAVHGMLPGQYTPTHSKTCLDHLIIKTKLHAKCLTIEASVTDHECVALNIELNSTIIGYQNSFNSLRIDYDGLNTAVQNIDYAQIQDNTDANLATDLLVTSLSSAVKNNSFTVKHKNRNRIIKPWITKRLLRCMSHRDYLYRKFKRDLGNEVIKISYKRYRNFCSGMLKKAKRTYEREQIEDAKNNKKKLWEVIKKVNGSNKLVDHSMCLISSYNYQQQTVNDINNYFANVGKTLAEVHQVYPLTPVTDVPVSFSLKSLALMPTDDTEVFNIISSLKENTAVGIDFISANIVKRYHHLLIPSITHICNLAMSTGTFPNAFKTALIKPIYKGGLKDCVSNYRPISILPTLSKILERIMNYRLLNYLEVNDLLAQNQYGFRRHRSTDAAVHELINSIVTSLDEGTKSLTIFLDLAKAFDTVSIPRLLRKLESIGIRGQTLNLFADYLTNRKQRVKIHNSVSDEITTEYGVPQGSIVGPTLFLVYINDLCRLQLHNGQILTFADDTALFFTGSDWDEVFANAQSGFNKVNSWLKTNILTLNINKTKTMAFASRSNGLPVQSLSIMAHTCTSVTSSCTCEKIERISEIKYLGVIIDQTLNFKSQVETLVRRLRKLTYLFRNLRHIANRKIIKMVYFALSQSLIQYCIASWGGLAKSRLIKVERAQRIILKSGAGLPFRYPTTELYKNWEVLTVRQIFILQVVLKKHSLLTYNPELIRDKRRKGAVCSIRSCNLSQTQKFFCYLGNYLYNKLNVKLNLYPLNYKRCKQTVTLYLKSLTYEQTEQLLISAL